MYRLQLHLNTTQTVRRPWTTSAYPIPHALTRQQETSEDSKIRTRVVQPPTPAFGPHTADDCRAASASWAQHFVADPATTHSCWACQSSWESRAPVLIHAGITPGPAGRCVLIRVQVTWLLASADLRGTLSFSQASYPAVEPVACSDATSTCPLVAPPQVDLYAP